VPVDNTRDVGGKRYTVKLLYEHADPEGAFATRLYDAFNTGLERREALKEMVALRHDKRGQSFLECACTEARLLARAGQHPNLPLLYDHVEESERVWLRMEFVEGNSLAQVFLRPDAKPPNRETVFRMLEVMLDVGRALDALHHCGIAHRDVSPANIIMTPHRTKLVDVGLAAWPGRYAYHAEGEGTLGYRSPEQTAARDPLTIPSLPSDVYGMGAVLYHLLTASPLPPLLPGQSPEPPGRINPAVPGALDDLVCAALAYNPQDRPGIGQLNQRLRAVREGLRQTLREPPSAIREPVNSSPSQVEAKTSTGEQAEPAASETKPPHPLAGLYNESAPKPSSLPIPPPMPREIRVSLPTSEEQHRATWRVILFALGMVFACAVSLATCSVLLWVASQWFR
jgi:serine/threonine protein kinase